MATFPTPPLRPYTNPWGTAGRAVSSLGQAVQELGSEQDRMRAAYQTMVAQRQDKLAAEARAARETALREEAAQRARDEADRAARQRTQEEAVRTQIQGRMGQAGFDRSAELGLYAEAGLEPPARFYTPEPPRPEAPVNWHTVDRPTGVYQVHPRTGQSRMVPGLPGRPSSSSGPTVAQLEAELAEWEAAANRLPPAPRPSNYAAYQAWERERASIDQEVRRVSARLAGLRATTGTPAAPPAPPPPAWGGEGLMPQVAPPYRRPRATNAAGEAVEWDGTAWRPVR